MRSQFDGGGTVTCVEQLQGYGERRNDVLYAPKLVDGDGEKEDVVVYFGGDVQVSEIILFSGFSFARVWPLDERRERRANRERKK